MTLPKCCRSCVVPLAAWALLTAPLPAEIVQTGNIEPDVNLWTSSTDGYIGRTSDGSATVDAGSMLVSQSGYLGYETAVTGTAKITGEGSKWTNSDGLTIGRNGAGTLLIEAGGEVNSLLGSRNYLGYLNGSIGAVTVTGAGSKWTNNGWLYVGNFGAGILTIEAGGQVNNPITLGSYLGYGGSTGAVTVTGAGSKWTNSGELYVGRSGNGTLSIKAGGEVSSPYGHSSYLGFDSAGTAMVTGAGSKWNNSGTLYIGNTRNGTLSIEAGGEVRSARSMLGNLSRSTGTVTVTGAGSKWTNNGWLDVGRDGAGTLTIEAGGEVSTTSTTLGLLSGSTGRGTVTGVGSKWTNSDGLTVGRDGAGTLAIEAGGEVSNTSAILGQVSGSTGTATVTGVSSKWTNSGNLHVGDSGNGALTIEDGGLVSIAGTLWIDSNSLGNSFINMTTGGMLALHADADDSLSQFLGLVQGSDALRFWDDSQAVWAPLTAGTFGVDYTLEYLDAGDLAGYTLLTVGGVISPALPGDFNADRAVDGADFLAWQRGGSPDPFAAGDLDIWKNDFGDFALSAVARAVVPEPTTLSLLALGVGALAIRRGDCRPTVCVYEFCTNC